jgi:hypothetical protein
MRGGTLGQREGDGRFAVSQCDVLGLGGDQFVAVASGVAYPDRSA